MSDPSTFVSIVDNPDYKPNSEITNTTPPPTKPATAPEPHAPQYQKVFIQDMHDFEAEQTAVNLQLAAETRARQTRTLIEPLKKKVKKVVDTEDLQAEEVAIAEMGSVNWVGKLQLYRDAHPVPPDSVAAGLEWEECIHMDPIPRFSFRLSISENPTIKFGLQTFEDNAEKVVSFSNKKLAKQFAAKMAVDWLIKEAYLEADGSVRQKGVMMPMGKKSKTVVQIESSQSYAFLLPELCQSLGFSPPTYRIVPVVAGSPIYNAWADFGGEPRINGPVGKVTNVYGKKNAKEEVAKLAVSFFRDMKGRIIEEEKAREEGKDEEGEGEEKEEEEEEGGGRGGSEK